MHCLLVLIALLSLLLDRAGALNLRENELNALNTRDAAACGDPNDAVTLLRAARSNNAAHFYTTSAAQMEQVIATTPDFRSQGDAGRVFNTQEPSTVPISRLNDPSITDNIYTSDPDEIASEEGNGFNDIGVYFYAYATQVCGSIPFYRVYSVENTDHLFTTNASERDVAIDTLGYVDEGVGFYILALPSE